MKTFDWIPQNDLLGHEKLKAFVSHMGNNGAYEAAYHGVPLIAAPVWMDNLSNTKRFEHKAKMAKFIDVFKADSSEWQNTIEDVLYNPRYLVINSKLKFIYRHLQFKQSSLASPFRAIFICILIPYHVYLHLHFILYSLAYSCCTVFISIFISCHIHLHHHFIPY